MSVTIAFVLLASTVVFYRALYLGARMSRKPWWAVDSWVDYLFGPSLLTTFALGVGLLIEAALDWSAQEFVATQAGASALIVVAAVVAWRLLTRWARTSTARSASGPSRIGSTPAPAAGDGDSLHRGDATHSIAPTPPRAA